MLVATATAFSDPRGMFEARILVDGQPLAVAPGKEGRYTMHSLHGKHYAIEVTNLTDARIEVIIAVNHRNVFNATQCAVPEEMIGFVIDAKSSYLFKGWRTSDQFVAQFAFDVDPVVIGVIGIGAFSEVSLAARETFLKDSNEAVHSGRVDNPGIPEEEAPFVLEALSVIPSQVGRTLFARQPGSLSMTSICYRSLEADRISERPLGFLSAGPRACLAAVPIL